MQLQLLSVRASPISKTAAALIVVVGLFVLLAGVVTGVLAEMVAGVAFVVLGVALWGLLLRFTRRLNAQTVDSAS